MNSIITELKKVSKAFYANHKEYVSDIILFGSFMRGKEKANDIDVLIVFDTSVSKEVEYEYRNKIAKLAKNVSVISKTQETYLSDSFDAREGILFEGYSLIRSRFIASDFGFAGLGIFIYQTKELGNAQKTKIYYALNGRRTAEGFIHATTAIRMSDNVLAFPLDQIENAKEFFNEWKLEYMYVPVLMPQRLARKDLLEKK